MAASNAADAHIAPSLHRSVAAPIGMIAARATQRICIQATNAPGDAFQSSPAIKSGWAPAQLHGRSRNAAHVMMSSLCVTAVAAIAYLIFGFAWQGFAGGPARLMYISGRPWSWAGAQPLFMAGLDWNASPGALVAWMQILCVALAAIIPIGAATERWRLGAMCASAALLAAITYPLFGHAAWGGGWLAQLGANYGLGQGFVDSGGSGVI